MNYFVESIYNYPEIEFDDEKIRIGDRIYPYEELTDIRLDGLMPFATYGLMHLFEGKKEHSVIIGKAAYRTLRQAIREAKPLLGKAAVKVESKAAAPVQEAAASDPYEEVKKLKELLDMEIITPEEFDRKKKQLLDL